MFFDFLQSQLCKMAVFLPKILLFRKIVVILYPIKFALMGNWHKICKELSKITNKITFLIKQ